MAQSTIAAEAMPSKKTKRTEADYAASLVKRFGIENGHHKAFGTLMRTESPDKYQWWLQVVKEIREIKRRQEDAERQKKR